MEGQKGDLIEGRRALGFGFGTPEVSKASWWVLGCQLLQAAHSVSGARGKVPRSRAEKWCQGCGACGVSKQLGRAGSALWAH